MVREYIVCKATKPEEEGQKVYRTEVAGRKSFDMLAYCFGITPSSLCTCVPEPASQYPQVSYKQFFINC